MTEYITAETLAWRNEQQAMKFDGYCHLTSVLLTSNPQGLTLATIQRVVGLSARTAHRVLAKVAIETNGKYYPKTRN